MKREARNHSKMRRLCRKLDVPLYQAMGILECLWHLTAVEAWRGDIGKLSNEDIALALDYRGDEDQLIEALIASGWIDKDETYRLLVHDWAEHADNTVQKRAKRSIESGQTGFYSHLSGHVQTFPSVSSLPEPEPEPVPEPEPDISEAKASSPRRDADGVGPDADGLIYAEYPRKEGYGAAIKAIGKAVDRIRKGEGMIPPMEPRDARDYLYRRVQYFARSPSGTRDDKTLIPHPATWFNQSRYLDDENNWEQTGGNGNGQGNGKSHRSPAKERVDANRRAIAETLASRGVDGPWNTPRAHGPEIPEPRPNGRATGVHDGPGAVSPELLPPKR